MFDVVIVGAGPAGLSVGSEISENLKVLIIDSKKEIGDCTKGWFIPSMLVNDNPEVLPFMYKGITRLLCKTAVEETCWDTHLHEGYYYVKEHEILEFWGEKAKKNGAEILLETQYIDHDVQDDKVVIETSSGKFEAKLLIDGSGQDSMVKKKYEIEQDYYWWSVYGAIVDHPNGLHGMKNGDYMLWQTFADTQASSDTTLRDGRPVFEYEILTETQSFPLILYLRKSKVDKEYMHNEFMHVLYDEETTSQFKDCEINELKWGWYPSGGLTVKQAADRVDFIGDAGCWTTPCGWGFGFIVDNYRYYGREITKLVQEDKLSEESIKSIVDFNVHEKNQILIDKIASHFLANASPKQLDKFIAFFNSNDPLVCEKIFTLTIEQDEIIEFGKKFLEEFSIFELIKIFPLEDWPTFIREIPYFFAETVIEEIKKLLGIELENEQGFEMGDPEFQQ